MIQRFWTRFLLEEDGQALVEYVLVIGLAMGMSVMINRLLQTGIKSFWFKLAGEIAAPCKTCTVPDAISPP